MKIEFNYVYYWLFIVFIFTSCADDMSIIDREQDLDQGIELYSLPDLIKGIFEFDKSMDQSDRNLVLKHVEQLYINYGTKELILSLMKSGVKIKITKLPSNSDSKNEAYCAPGFSIAEIGFKSHGYITIENLLHELLHLYAYMNYRDYENGFDAACEEYEVRVLTDLIMSKYFKGVDFKHQGVYPLEANYYKAAYKEWLQNIIDTSNCDMDLFKKNFQKYGSMCVLKFDFEDKVGAKINVEDLNHYTPRLINVFWSGF